MVQVGGYLRNTVYLLGVHERSLQVTPTGSEAYLYGEVLLRLLFRVAAHLHYHPTDPHLLLVEPSSGNEQRIDR